MKDSELAECKDHGGDWGLSCGFYAKYPSLADLHISRVHVNDYIEVIHEPSAGSRTIDIAENYPDDPDYVKQYFVFGPITNLIAILALYFCIAGAIVLASVAIVWFAQQVASWF